MDKFSLILVIIGALNWLLIGLFNFNLVDAIFGGETSTLVRIIYSIVGVAGLWCIGILVRMFKETSDRD